MTNLKVNLKQNLLNIIDDLLKPVKKSKKKI